VEGKTVSRTSEKQALRVKLISAGSRHFWGYVKGLVKKHFQMKGSIFFL